MSALVNTCKTCFVELRHSFGESVNKKFTEKNKMEKKEKIKKLKFTKIRVCSDDQSGSSDSSDDCLELPSTPDKILSGAEELEEKIRNLPSPPTGMPSGRLPKLKKMR